MWNTIANGRAAQTSELSKLVRPIPMLIMLLAAAVLIGAQYDPFPERLPLPIAREAIGTRPFANLSGELDPTLPTDMAAAMEYALFGTRGGGGKTGSSHFIEGSVQKLGGKLVVKAALVRADTGETVWFKEYRYSFKNTKETHSALPYVASMIAKDIVHRVRLPSHSG